MAKMDSFTHSDAYLLLQASNDKYLVTYTLLKLGLVTGKILLYVGTVSSAYRLKLFLEEFSIKSLLLNYEHPKSTRHLAVSNFINKSPDVLIIIDPDEEESQNKGTKRHKIYRNPVNVLINFDFPTSRKLYRKRISDIKDQKNAKVTILNFVLSTDTELLENTNQKLRKTQKNAIEELNLKMSEFEKFRYRCEDVLRRVTHKRIHTTRMNDVKKALLSAPGLKEQLETNPHDKQVLQQAKKKFKPQRYLATVPDYLLPEALKSKPKTKPAAYNKQEFENKLAKREKRLPRDFLQDETIEEEPGQIHYTDLPITSNRKIWKIKHHHSLNTHPRKKHKKL